MEGEERSGGPEREVRRMERDSERLGEHIDETREDWEVKERDASVPGAQPDPGEEETSTGNSDAAGSEEPDE